MLVIVCRVIDCIYYDFSRMKATQSRIQLGNKIRSLRKKQGVSQEELGFKAGVHRTYIGAIERAEQNVSIDNIHKIAKALKVPVEDLFKH